MYRRMIVICLCGWQGLVGVVRGDDAATLAAKLPRDSNAVFIVRVADILQTPRAAAEGWSEQQAEKFLSGGSAIPPWVGTLVTGSLVRPAEADAEWAAALLTTPADTTLESLVGIESPEVETLGVSRAVHGQSDALFLEVQPGLFGVLTPAHRQDAARWSRQMAAGGDPQLSPNLLQAAQTPGHIVLAMDFEHLLDPQQVRRRLGAEPVFLTAPELVARMAQQLSGLRTVTMSITIGEQFAAVVTCSFAAPLQDSANLFRSVFVSILHDLGVGIDEFDAAAASVNGSDLQLQTNLSEESVRRILTLIVPPAPHPQSVAAAPPTPPKGNVTKTPVRPGPRDFPGRATQQYVLAVDKMIDNLKVANRNAQTYERTATWHDNFARRIADLPTVGVDPDVVNYGLKIAEDFRALSASLRGQGVQVASSQGTLTYNYSFNPGWVQANWWGPVGFYGPSYNVTSNLQQVREQQARAIEAGAVDRTQIWTQIDNTRAATEVALKQRYGDDFYRRK